MKKHIIITEKGEVLDPSRKDCTDIPDCKICVILIEEETSEEDIEKIACKMLKHKERFV